MDLINYELEDLNEFEVCMSCGIVYNKRIAKNNDVDNKINCPVCELEVSWKET